MSILSGLSAIVKDQKKRLTNVVDTFKAIGSNFAQGKILTSVPVAKKYEGTVIGTAASILTKPAVIAAAAVSPALVKTGVAASVASTAGKAIVSNPVGAVKTGAVAVVGTNILLSSKKAQQAVVKTPSALAKLGTDIGKTIDNPSVSNITSLIKENKEAVAVIGIAAGTAAVSAGLTYANTQAVKKNTEATLKAATPVITEKLNNTVPLLAPAVPSVASPAATSAAVPTVTTPQEAAVSKPKKATKKKKAKKKATKKKKAKKKATKRKSIKKIKRKAKTIKKRKASKKKKSKK